MIRRLQRGARLVVASHNAGKVAERVKAGESLSPRARQVGLQVVLRTSLDRKNVAALRDQP